MSEYLFARRYPKGHLRRSVAPVHPSGWMVVWAYLALILLGGLGFLLLSQADRLTAGVVLFVAVSVVAGGGMIANVQKVAGLLIVNDVVIGIGDAAGTAGLIPHEPELGGAP